MSDNSPNYTFDTRIKLTIDYHKYTFECESSIYFIVNQVYGPIYLFVGRYTHKFGNVNKELTVYYFNLELWCI